MNNKKGAEMTIGTIIVIILALVVLVVLIYGFSTGWSNLWQNIIGYGGGKVNVQNVVQSCQVACTTSATYDYCTRMRSVTFDDNATSLRNKQQYTCKWLENENVGLTCSNVDCSSQSGIGKDCKAWGGEERATGTCGSLGSIDWVQSLTDQNKVCCVVKKNCEGATGWNGKWIDAAQDCDSGYSQVVSVSKIIPDADVTAHAGKKCCLK